MSDKEEVLDRLLEQLRRDFFGPRVPVPRQIVAALAEAYEEGVNGQTATPTAIGDGFGNAWSAYCPTCKQKSMYISRPGDARCSKCESEQAPPTKCSSPYHRPTSMFCLDCIPPDAPISVLLLSNREPTEEETKRGLDIAKLMEQASPTPEK